MVRRWNILIASLLLLSASVSADWYVWTNPQGEVQFSSFRGDAGTNATVRVTQPPVIRQDTARDRLLDAEQSKKIEVARQEAVAVLDNNRSTDSEKIAALTAWMKANAAVIDVTLEDSGIRTTSRVTRVRQEGAHR